MVSVGVGSWAPHKEAGGRAGSGSWGGYRPCYPKTQLCVREGSPWPPGDHRASRVQLHPPASCLVPKEMACSLGAGAASPSPASRSGVRWGDAPHLVGLLSRTATRELDAAPHCTPTINAAPSRAPASLGSGVPASSPLSWLQPSRSLCTGSSLRSPGIDLITCGC